MFFCFEQEVWSMMTPCVTISDDGMRLMCCFHHSSVYIYISLMIMKLWIVLWDYLFSALNKYCSFQICFGCLVWSITQVISTRQETPSIVCPKQVLWTGFKFVLLSRLINYASDYNAPQKRLVLKKYVLFYIYIMGAVSLLSAAGVGDGSASSGDLRVSLFSWISSKNFSRKGRSIKEKVTLAVNWRRRPSLPSLSMYTGMQNFPSFSFLCYSLLVDLYLLIVPKLRSAFLDLQFCRRWASNFCCNLSYYYYF